MHTTTHAPEAAHSTPCDTSHVTLNADAHVCPRPWCLTAIATPRDRYEAFTTGLMLALRTDAGVNFDELRREYPQSDLGAKAAAACIEAANELPAEWVRVEPESEGAALPSTALELDASDCVGLGHRLRLTQPEGFLFSNEAISTVFARLSDAVEDESEGADEDSS